jgi:hypothetical protein
MNINNFQKYKQIEFDENTNKLFLIDYNNNKIECNLFGSPIPTFPSKKQTKNFSNKIENFYRPIENKFDGYFSFPNPISFPFINEKKINKNKLIQQIFKENRFNSNFSKKFLFSKEKNLISYFNSKISDNEKNIKNFNNKIINHLINLINEHIKEKKIKNNFIEDIEKKDKKIKNLLKFKNSLLTKKNSLKLNLPNEKNLIEYKIIQKVIKNKKNDENQNFNDEIYKKLNSIPGIKNISLLNNKNKKFKYKNNSMANLQININQYYNDIKKIKNNNKNFSISNKESENFNKNVLSNKDNKTITTEIENTNNNLNNLNNNFNNNNNKFNRNFTHKNIIENNNKFKEKIIKSFSEINIKSAKENKLLEGYKTIEIKEKPIFKHYNFKPKNAGENYLKDQQLLDKINPVYKQLKEEKILKDKQLFEKRKKNKLIYELVLLKKKINK